MTRKEGNRLRVEVTVENRSRYDNAVAMKAMIAVSRDEDGESFELDLLDDRKLAAYSVVNKVFQSKPAHEIDVKKRNLMETMNESRNLKCRIAIVDLHRNVWRTDKQGCKNDGIDLKTLERALEPS